MAKKIDSQNQRILNHMLRTGHITALQAWDAFGVRSLTRRITDLREVGHEIKAEWMRHLSTGQRYMRYHYVQPAARPVAA